MANRAFVNGPRTLDTETISLFGTVVIGATTSVTSQDCNGFTVTALGTGTLTITTDDAYPAIVGARLCPLCATASDSNWQMITASPTTKAFTIRNAPGGVATAPLTGSTLYIELILRNTAAPRKGSA